MCIGGAGGGVGGWGFEATRYFNIGLCQYLDFLS